MLARQLARCAEQAQNLRVAIERSAVQCIAVGPRAQYQTGAGELEPWHFAHSTIEEAETPPSSWYTAPAAAQAEHAAVFKQSWQFLGASSCLQQPGDYLSSLVAGSPYMACLDAGGKLLAFHNVCRHHAAAVCEDGCGNTAHFTCPYHGWVYGLDGRLQKPSKLKGIRNFKASQMGLLPVEVDTWQGLAFINPNNSRKNSLQDWLGQGGEAMAAAGISLHGMQHVQSRTYHINCNWKVFCDNYLDGGYHVPHAHKALASGLHLDSYSSQLYERLSIQSCDPLQSPAEQETRLGSRAAAYAFLYPNIMLNRYGPWLDINIVEPTGTESCQVRFEYYLEPSAGLDASVVADGLDSSHEVQLEDVKLCESVQRGLRSAAYDTGRYAPSMEKPMFHFHQVLHDDLFK